MAYTAPRTWVAGETLTAALLNAHLRDNLNAAFPVGSLHFFMQAATTAATTIEGFALECNGTAVSRATYAALNTKLSGLSYPFGTGDGSTTMNLPDLQGRSLVAMASGGHADVNALGDSDGLAKASRSPQHNSTNGLSLTGAPTIGTLAIGNNGTYNPIAMSPLTGNPWQEGTGTTHGFSNANNSLTLTGAPAKGTLAVSGTVGPGGTRPTDTVAYLVPGVWGVHY